MNTIETGATSRLKRRSFFALAAATVVAAGANSLQEKYGVAAKNKGKSKGARSESAGNGGARKRSAHNGAGQSGAAQGGSARGEALRGGAAQLVQSFANTTPITIQDNTVANPYPTAIEVSGFETPVAQVTITINGFSHSAPEQADMLLVGPGGETVIFWSDLGALNPANNVTLTFDDNAPSKITIGTPLPTNGTFQPTNGNTTGLDNFPPPAPMASGSKLGVFRGTNPNGTWRLFVMDQGVGNTGSISGGWSMVITAANGTPKAAPDTFQASARQTLTVPAEGVLGNDSDPDGDALTASLAGDARQGIVSLQPDGSFTYTANKNARGIDSFTYLAQDASGLSDLETVTIQITGAKRRKKRRRR